MVLLVGTKLNVHEHWQNAMSNLSTPNLTNCTKIQERKNGTTHCEPTTQC